VSRRTFVKAIAGAGSARAVPRTLQAQPGVGEATLNTEGHDMQQAAPQTGYAPVNGLQMYYEIHGSGGTPLLLLHGGLFNIDLQFGELLAPLAESRQVIAADFQAHGRTNDVDDRPLSSASLTSDIVGLLRHLQVDRVDVFGYSMGDCDAVLLEHAVRFLQLRGGDVNGDFVGVPASQLAVLPGTTHFFGMSRPSLVLELVVPFLDAPMPEAG